MANFNRSLAVGILRKDRIVATGLRPEVFCAVLLVAPRRNAAAATEAMKKVNREIRIRLQQKQLRRHDRTKCDIYICKDTTLGSAAAEFWDVMV